MGQTPHSACPGSRFIIYTVMNDDITSQAAKPAGLPQPGQASPPERILMVEDDGDIRRLNAEVLIHAGYHVDAAADGAAAWDALCVEQYDLIITDNIMPKLTGVELLKKLRSARMELPVIMATGTIPQEEFTRCPWLQPAATLLKPYTVEALLGTVKNVLCATDSA
jgi:DNA-binding response OmpR family regulator